MSNTKIIYLFFFLVLMIQNGQGQDWANLERYKKENSQLKEPKANEKRVVFMGNSITEGWSRLSPDFSKDKPYINRVISGQTTPQMVLRFKQDVINLKPSVVVILAGINDIAQNTGPMTLEETATNIFTMAELAKVHGIKVIMCTVLPAAAFPWRPQINPAPKVVELNLMLKKYAKEHNITFVDYYTPMVNQSQGLKNELGEDGVHPNAKGYTIMEQLISSAIAKLSPKK